MPTVNTQFEVELKKRVAARMDDIRDALSDGTAIKDYADYKRYVGEYQGLKQVVETYCDEVTTTINQR